MTKSPQARRHAMEAVRTLLYYMGEDPDRDGLKDTPARFLKAWEQDWGSSYGVNPPDMKMFVDVGLPAPHAIDKVPMVLVRGIRFHSHCEHHIAPFYGTADVAYIPTMGVVGLSKLARLVHHFARCLQVQERLTNQIADEIFDGAMSAPCGVLLRATHTCMLTRGVREPDSTTTTAALRGVFLTDPMVRAEFLQHCYAR
jgi:GTP cyclohydrolase I